MEDYTIPTPEEQPSALFAAALALGTEARRRGSEAVLPAAHQPPAGRFLLTEGMLSGLFILVTVPSGAVWRYRHSLPESDGRVVLCHIDTTVPLVCGVFQPTAEGIHPFVGQALRFGVDRSVA